MGAEFSMRFANAASILMLSFAKSNQRKWKAGEFLVRNILEDDEELNMCKLAARQVND